MNDMVTKIMDLRCRLLLGFCFGLAPRTRLAYPLPMGLRSMGLFKPAACASQLSTGHPHGALLLFAETIHPLLAADLWSHCCCSGSESAAAPAATASDRLLVLLPGCCRAIAEAISCRQVSAGPAVGAALVDASVDEVVPRGALRIRLLLRSNRGREDVSR